MNMWVFSVSSIGSFPNDQLTILVRFFKYATYLKWKMAIIANPFTSDEAGFQWGSTEISSMSNSRITSNVSTFEVIIEFDLEDISVEPH